MSYFQLSVILLTVFMSACAQLLLKMGMNKASMSGGFFDNGVWSVLQLLYTPLVFFGGLVYMLSFIAWLWVLSKVELSLAYPFVGISFVFTLIFGVFVLGESINIYKLVGTFMIVIGCFLMRP
jgi:multidrug transporter EmrE-like cation transporter